MRTQLSTSVILGKPSQVRFYAQPPTEELSIDFNMANSSPRSFVTELYNLHLNANLSYNIMPLLLLHHRLIDPFLSADLLRKLAGGLL